MRFGKVQTILEVAATALFFATILFSAAMIAVLDSLFTHQKQK